MGRVGSEGTAPAAGDAGVDAGDGVRRAAARCLSQRGTMPRAPMARPSASAKTLAEEWRPYAETCIESFGVTRCMFESNFPVDMGSCDYVTLWNAFKLISQYYSSEEKTYLFRETAKRIYRLEV